MFNRSETALLFHFWRVMPRSPPCDDERTCNPTTYQRHDERLYLYTCSLLCVQAPVNVSTSRWTLVFNEYTHLLHRRINVSVQVQAPVRLSSLPAELCSFVLHLSPLSCQHFYQQSYQPSYPLVFVTLSCVHSVSRATNRAIPLYLSPLSCVYSVSRATNRAIPYHLSPLSCVHSVSRTLSASSYPPFAWHPYHMCTRWAG